MEQHKKELMGIIDQHLKTIEDKSQEISRHLKTIAVGFV
jgi:hypothetical protein